MRFPSLCIPLAVLVAVLVFAVRTLSAQSSLPSGSPVVSPAPTPAEVIPPSPTHWFSDYAKITSPIFAIELDRRLEAFEHATTNQFIVVIFPKMQSTASIGDYCLRVFNAWHVGQKGVNNGCVLFVFVEDHKLYIRVGSGLWPPLSDEVCGQIGKQIGAIFRQGDFEKGITTGVDAIVQTLQKQPSRHAAP